ncbi:MAG: CBS domain-containing protein [Ruminococcaceae bacterium]|nr:CBS domain-containing protein [Oscillospiraceae bacterium]
MFIDYIVEESTSVAEALGILERNEYKVLAVESDRLIGIVTDGDIRRFLLNNGDISQPVSLASSKNPVFLKGFNEGKARKILFEKSITCVPMTDDSGAVHALVFKDTTFHREGEALKNHVIIMAGGFGTRLYPYTDILPKPLMPMGKSTITEIIIERFRKFGCRDITLVVNHRKNLIKSYFSEKEQDYNLEFVDEDTPLGTAGGLAFFKNRFSDDVFMTYCDNIIETDYRDIMSFHKREKNILTLVAARKRVTVPYGVVELNENGSVSEIREKPSEEYLINAGFYVISPRFIEKVKDNEFQHITDLIKQCISEGEKIGVYPIDEESFIDAGQIENLKEAKVIFG